MKRPRALQMSKEDKKNLRCAIEKEAKALDIVGSPYVMNVLARAPDSLSIVMDLVPEGSLLSRLRTSADPNW